MSYNNLVGHQEGSRTQVKGITMSRNPLKAFAHDCVVHYSKYNSEDYQLNLNDLPDFTQQEFAALIMIQEPERANESTGVDNQDYEKTMLPTLIKFLQDTTDRDEQIEFLNAWKKSVTSYHKQYMQELIDEALENYNQNHGYVIRDHHNYYGVSSLFNGR